MKIFPSGNWGLRLLALILAIVIYHTLKNDSHALKNTPSSSFGNETNSTSFQPR